MEKNQLLETFKSLWSFCTTNHRDRLLKHTENSLEPSHCRTGYGWTRQRVYSLQQTSLQCYRRPPMTQLQSEAAAASSHIL